MTLKHSPASLFVAIAWFSLLGFGSSAARAQQPAEKVLYSFTGSSGANPEAGLIRDASGNLYGTTQDGGADNEGTVFELVNSSGTYSERVLYSFTGSNGDGATPDGALIIDASGNLYGTTFNGGEWDWGTVFELVNSSGNYTEQLLYSFTGMAVGGDGANPNAALITDASGNLYGTTVFGGAAGQGTVFELVNSSGSYSEQVLYSFTGSNGDGANPYGGLVMDASGNLYGTTVVGGNNGFCQQYATDGCGIVFELVNSSGSYSEQVLNTFTGSNGDGAYPFGGLVMDVSGNLYGTTLGGGAQSCNGLFAGCGTVFKLLNSSGSFSETVLYSFTGSNGDGATPYGALIIDASGNLYGTTGWGGGQNSNYCTGPINGCGSVFELVNSSGNYSEKVLHGFTGPDGANPSSALIMDASGNFYGTTTAGGDDGNGSVFEIVNTTTLSISSSLNPSAYGQSVTYTATFSQAFAQVAKRRSWKGMGQPVTGSVTWSANTGCGTTAIDAGQAQCVTSILPAGDDTVTASYSGIQNAAVASISQAVNPDSTTIKVTGVSPSSEQYGQDAPATITAVLSWSFGASAPSAAKVSIGGNGHGSYALTTCGSPSGNTMTCTATYTANAQDTAGTYTETAEFSGDSNYTGSSSSQSGNFVVTETVKASDFAVSSTPTSAVVVAGQSARFTVTVTPQGSFAKSIRFSCSGLPEGVNCAFNPATVTPGAKPTGIDLTITTAAATASLASPALGNRSRPLYALWLLLPAMLLATVGLAKPRRRRLLNSIFLCLLAGGCCLQAACGAGISNGGSHGTAAGTYTITVTGTADSTQHSTTLKLTVQ